MNKRQSKIIAGFAIVMMVAHHSFGFQEYFFPGNNYIPLFSIHGIAIERVFAAYGKLCVALFAFSSGFVMYVKTENYASLKLTAPRLLRFLANYWLFVALFIAYGAIMNAPLPNLPTLAQNLLGIATGPHNVAPYTNVSFAWYVFYYSILLLLAPALVRLFAKTRPIADAILLIAFSIALKYICSISAPLSTLYILPSSICGLLTAKYNLLARLPRHLSRWPIACALLAVMVVVRQGMILLNVPSIGFEDGIFSLLTIACFLSIANAFPRLANVAHFLGIHSMNIWFLHGLFFTMGGEPLQALVYAPRYSPLILLLAFAILIPLSLAINKLIALLTPSKK